MSVAYQQMKLGRWKQYEYDRDGYTDAKGPFIAEYTRIAGEQYKGRYADVV